MKLLAQTNRRYLLISLMVLAVSSGALFLGVRRLFDDNVDERLAQLKSEIISFVQVQDTLPVFFQSTSAKLVVKRTETLPVESFSDTLLFNEIEQEQEPYRRLRFGLQMRKKLFQVDVMQSDVETEDIAQMVLTLNLSLLAAMFIVLFWAQKWMSNRLWRPFYTTLEQLRLFRLLQPEPLHLPETDTDEFSELNTALERLTEKARQEYHSLKRFTENASHEIQTPLAVIQVKLETILQSEGLSSELMQHLHITQRAAARLSRLQHNLLLLVKIENDQFDALESIDLKQQVDNKLALLEDFIAAKQLHVHTELEPVCLQLNPFLSETVIGNLIGNAVKHNLPKDGTLAIHLNKQAFTIRNSAVAPHLPPAALMERFQRNDTQADGLGMGLSIAKEICDKYGWRLEIGFENQTWTVVVYFQSDADLLENRVL